MPENLTTYFAPIGSTQQLSPQETAFACSFKNILSFLFKWKLVISEIISYERMHIYRVFWGPPSLAVSLFCFVQHTDTQKIFPTHTMVQQSMLSAIITEQRSWPSLWAEFDRRIGYVCCNHMVEIWEWSQATVVFIVAPSPCCFNDWYVTKSNFMFFLFIVFH